MRKYILLFIAPVLMVFRTMAQPLDPALVSKLQQKLDSIQVADNLQGISAAIIYPGHGLWSGVSGKSHSDVSVSPDMRFHIASNTKTFTAVMLLKLVQNNLVSLGDSIHEWLPNYNPNINPNSTLRQLLNHTSGIANTFDVPGFTDSLSADWHRVFTQPEILSWLPEPLFAPGKGQRYSNPNYHLAGLVVESVSGQHLEKLIRDSILVPLGMNGTYFPLYDTVTGSIAHPWQSNVDWYDTCRTSLLTSQWAAGAMYSTAEDMAIWYNELFNNQFLDSIEYLEMTALVGPQKRGLGIEEINLAGRVVWGHGGNTIGYSSTMIYDTASQAVIAVLVNEAPSHPLSIAEELLQTLIYNPALTIHRPERNDSVVIYPNPANGWVNLHLTQDVLKQIFIFDLNGKLVKTTHSNSFNIGELLAGQYHVKIVTKEQVLNRAIIKY